MSPANGPSTAAASNASVHLAKQSWTFRLESIQAGHLEAAVFNDPIDLTINVAAVAHSVPERV